MLGIAHVLTLGLGVATTMIWTRWLPQETFGQYKVVIAFLSITAVFCQQGIGQAAIMSSSKNFDGNLRLLLKSKLISNLGGSGIILCGAAYYAWVDRQANGMVFGLLAAAICFPVFNTTDIWFSWLNGKSLFSRLAAGRVFASFVGLVCVACLGAAGVRDVWIAVLAYLAAMVAVNMVMLSISLRERSNDTKDAEVINFGRQMTLVLMVSGLLPLDMIVLERNASASDVATYAVALLFPDQIKAIFSIFTQALAPRMLQSANFRELWLAIRGQFIAISAGFFIVGVAGFFALPAITTALFTAKYAEAATYGSWLWLTVGSLGSTSLLGYALTAKQKLITTYAASAGYPFALGFFYFLWMDAGVKGMVAARIAAALLLSMVFVSSFIFYLRTERREGYSPATTH